jgi:isopenicillin N synthase-like dioxygenase
VDLHQDEATAAQQVYAACSGPGFFYAANHGIPQELLSEVFRQMRAAFAMPEEAKMAMLADENNRGCKHPVCKDGWLAETFKAAGMLLLLGHLHGRRQQQQQPTPQHNIAYLGARRSC